ncbi:MAG: triose-phosphate isomerase [Bacteriovoracia bacterium]
MRKRIIAGNWKMNFSPKQAEDFFEAIGSLGSASKVNSSKKAVIFPVAYCLNQALLQKAESAGFKVGAQNVHWEEKGAFTGELSGSALKEIGVNNVLIAHSERRSFFGETNESACRRLKKALDLGLEVIFCVGETQKEREANQTESVLETQLSGFYEILKSHKNQSNCSIAYEPVWAIGTGLTASAEQADQAHRFIRALAERFQAGLGSRTPILYGGSVTAQNAKALLSLENIDGVLVGGASLKPADFFEILSVA